MDPIGCIVTALVAGAAAGVKDTVPRAIKDGYSALKAIVRRKYGAVSLDLLEADPASPARAAVLQEDLSKTTAGQDDELLTAAASLTKLIEEHAPAYGASGAILDRVRAASLALQRIRVQGHATGFIAKDVDVSGAIVVQDVQVEGPSPHPKR